MEKITFSEAQKMCRGTGHTLWHIKWYPPLEREYPDCSHFVVSRGGDHQERKYHLALVLRNIRAERRHRLQELRREGRHAMAEILEEQWQTEEIDDRVRVYSDTDEYIGHGTVIEHEPVCSGFVKGFIAFIRMGDGSSMRVLFVPPAEVRLENTGGGSR